MNSDSKKKKKVKKGEKDKTDGVDSKPDKATTKKDKRKTSLAAPSRKTSLAAANKATAGEDKKKTAKGGKFAKTKKKKKRGSVSDAPPEEVAPEPVEVTPEPVEEVVPEPVVEEIVPVVEEIQPEVTEYDNESEDEYYDPNDPNAAPWVEIFCPRQEQFYYYNYMSGDTEWDFPDGENVYTWSTFKSWPRRRVLKKIKAAIKVQCLLRRFFALEKAMKQKLKMHGFDHSVRMARSLCREQQSAAAERVDEYERLDFLDRMKRANIETGEVRDSLSNRIQELEQQLETVTSELKVTTGKYVHLRDNFDDLKYKEVQAAVEVERQIKDPIIAQLKLELDEERRNKNAHRKWLARFDETQKEEVYYDDGLKHMTMSEYAFSHFSEIVASLRPDELDQPLFTASGVLEMFTHLAAHSTNSLLVGPALVALVHLVMISDVNKRILVQSEDAVGALLGMLKEFKKFSDEVLVEIGRVFTAVGTIDANKVAISSRGGIKMMVGCLAHCKSPKSKNSILSALVNLSHNSDPNRTLIVSLGGLPLIVGCLETYAQSCANPDGSTEGRRQWNVLLQAARLLGNLAFNHNSNQAEIVSASGDSIMIKLLHDSKIDAVTASCAYALANLAHTERNQAQLGADNTTQILVRHLRTSKDDAILHSSSLAIASLSFQCPQNKNQVVEHEGVEPLIILCQATMSKDVIIIACKALTTIACNDTTNRCVHSAGALPNLIKLCNTVSDREILHAAAMSLVSLAPEAEVKLRSDKEMRMLPFEVMGGVKALKRASQELYLNAGEEVPPWMQTPLDVLVPNDRPPKTADKNKKRVVARTFAELYHRSSLAKEFNAGMTFDENYAENLGKISTEALKFAI